MNDTDDRALAYLISFGILILISALGAWLAKRRMKRKLEEGLGHEVKDGDVTSISAWMKADDTVVDSVIHDNSRERAIESAMEDYATNWVAQTEKSRISLQPIIKRFKRRALAAPQNSSLQTVRGVALNVQHGVDAQDSRIDLTNFDLAGRAMQSSSLGPQTIEEGDELIVAGKPKEGFFDVMEYRNLTRKTNSYRSQGPPIMRIFAGSLSLVGLVGSGWSVVAFLQSGAQIAWRNFMEALLSHHGLVLMVLVISVTLLGCGLYFLYLDKAYREARKAIENYK